MLHTQAEIFYAHAGVFQVATRTTGAQLKRYERRQGLTGLSFFLKNT